MDATSTTIRAALAICAATLLMSCTTPQPPQTQSVEPIESNGYDFTENAGKALHNLDAFLQSVTTTTSIAAIPQNRIAPNYAPGDGSVWDDLAQCESGGNWAYPPVSGGFSGGIMFHIGTWRAMGGLNYAPDAYLATREQQIEIATQVLNTSGWGAWPGCARKLGLMR